MSIDTLRDQKGEHYVTQSNPMDPGVSSPWLGLGASSSDGGPTMRTRDKWLVGALVVLLFGATYNDAQPPAMGDQPIVVEVELPEQTTTTTSTTVPESPEQTTDEPEEVVQAPEPTTTTTSQPVAKETAETPYLEPGPEDSDDDCWDCSIYDEDYVDPDIEWAERVGPETRARVLAGVDLYLADPDLNAPACWEDEAIVVIVDHVTPEGPYVVPKRVGEIGCVPLDNLPTSGNRPAP